MAALKPTEPSIIKKFVELRRGAGYVLNFSDAEFEQFMRDVSDVDIYSKDFEKYGNSKGKRLKVFLEIASDLEIGKALFSLVDQFKTDKMLEGKEISQQEDLLIDSILGIASRLIGDQKSKHISPENEFLHREFGDISVKGLGFDKGLEKVLVQRIEEVKRCLKSQSSLSVIFLSGSTLEGVLLGVANKNIKSFNQAKSAPRNKDNKVKVLSSWTLNELINVATELEFIGLDVQKFSHALRDFRNYIHPNAQWKSGFDPDFTTAEMSWQVLRAALNDLNKESNF